MRSLTNAPRLRANVVGLVRSRVAAPDRCFEEDAHYARALALTCGDGSAFEVAEEYWKEILSDPSFVLLRCLSRSRLRRR